MHAYDNQFTQLRKGLLEFAILSTLAGARQYVADIMNRLTDTPFETSEGTLYPLLSRLKREGLVTYDWVESDVGPPRKYYRLTQIGEARLAQMDEYWHYLYTNIEQLGGNDAKDSTR
jgi:PadR family transcriptional regulator PadR